VEYRNLGRSGLLVSAVGLGCNNFGGRVDPMGTKAVVDKAIEMGITLFDTSDVYGPRLSEEYLAPALKPHRRNIVIATKSSKRMGEGPYWAGTSRKYLIEALEDCLRRLDTDYIDLYQMHDYDPRTPIEETMRALDDMITSGKVRYIGNSNYTAAQVVETHWVAKTEHLNPFISAQNEYSLLSRGARDELLPLCEKYGIGFLPFYPLASGFLTGKYRPGQAPPEGTRLAPDNAYTAKLRSEQNYALLGKLEDFASRTGRSMLELAFGWLASQPVVSSVIAGATKPEQVEQNVKAGETRLSADEMKEIDEILASV
jgi:aryl-alcohol dehydrogenase-like predicted oxidoreductase